MRFFLLVIGWAGVTAIAGRVAADPAVTMLVAAGSVL